MPFERFEEADREENRQIKRYIGTFVSRKVVKDGKATVAELNQADRWELANKWYDCETKLSPWKVQRFGKTIDRFYNGSLDAFLREVAVFIDERIPKSFLKHQEKNHDRSPATYAVTPVSDGTLPFGLVYQFKENYPRNGHKQQRGAGGDQATEKQIRYLENLAWKKNHYFHKDKEISKKEASECIDYFLNMGYEEEPDCFKRFFKPTM